MAQRVVISLTDDIDGKEADETIRFGLDGHFYEIDLTAHNGTALREALAPYIRAARKATGGNANTRTAKPTTTNGNKAAAIRRWATAQGIDGISERGRVPASVVTAYKARDTHDAAAFLKVALREHSSQNPGQTAVEIPEQRPAHAGSANLSKEPTDIPAEDMTFDTTEERKRWLGRTSGPDKVENLSTEKRLSLLGPKHYAILQALAAGTAGTEIKGWKTFDAKLRNLGYIGFDDLITRTGLAALEAYLASSNA